MKHGYRKRIVKVDAFRILDIGFYSAKTITLHVEDMQGARFNINVTHHWATLNSPQIGGFYVVEDFDAGKPFFVIEETFRKDYTPA